MFQQEQPIEFSENLSIQKGNHSPGPFQSFCSLEPRFDTGANAQRCAIRQQHASIRLLGINLRLRWICRFGPVMNSGGCHSWFLLLSEVTHSWTTLTRR